MKCTKKQHTFLCLWLFIVCILLQGGNGLSRKKHNFIGIPAAEENREDLEGSKSKSQYLESGIIDKEDDNAGNGEDVEQVQDTNVDKNEERASQKQIITETQSVPIDLTQDNRQQNKISSSNQSSDNDEVIEEEKEQEIEVSESTTPAVKSKASSHRVSQKMAKLMNLVHDQTEGFKQQSQKYYSQLTNHLDGQINIFMGILGIILAFCILFITVKGFSNDFPFLRGLSNSTKTSNYGFTSPYSEAFYTGYDFTNSNNRSSISNPQAKNACNKELQVDRNWNSRKNRQQGDNLKDYVSPSEYLFKKISKNRQDFPNIDQNVDDTFFENENDFLIKDLFDFEEHQQLETSNQDLDLEEQSSIKMR